MTKLPTGKLPAELLAALLSRAARPDARVVFGPGIGQDAAVIDMGDRYLVAKTDPITFATDAIGWYAVNVNANDIACMGARPRWFMASVLLPEGRADAVMAETIFEQMADACAALDVTLVGGHTEITYALERPIVIGAMLGEVAKDKLVTSAGARSGDVVLLTRGVPIEGAALIAREKEAALLARGFSPAFVARAKGLLRDPGISVVREALIAAEAGLATAMHDPTEGGVATGLWELAQAAHVGLEVEVAAIPIVPEGARLCAEFGLDPLGTIASGALLIVSPADRAPRLIELLRKAGILCVRIGRIVDKERGIGIQPFRVDEITRIFAGGT